MFQNQINNLIFFYIKNLVKYIFIVSLQKYLKHKQMNKKRIYSLDQKSLEVIKKNLKEQGKKSNNQTAAAEAVCWYAKTLSK